MLESYPFVNDTVGLFQVPRDAAFALDQVKRNACTRSEQEACVAAMRFKCDTLWAQLDALPHAYVDPSLVPSGAFRPAYQPRRAEAGTRKKKPAPLIRSSRATRRWRSADRTTEPVIAGRVASIGNTTR